MTFARLYASIECVLVYLRAWRYPVAHKRDLGCVRIQASGLILFVASKWESVDYKRIIYIICMPVFVHFIRLVRE